MTDTTFVPSDAQLAGSVTLYDGQDGKLVRIETPGWLSTKTFFSGGGGLWSTAEDYMRFGQMLANGGVLNGKRILSPRTVDLMASNHVGELYSGTGGTVKGLGFGLTVDVVLDNAAAGRRAAAAPSRGAARSACSGSIGRTDRRRADGAEPVNSLRTDFQNAVMSDYQIAVGGVPE